MRGIPVNRRGLTNSANASEEAKIIRRAAVLHSGKILSAPLCCVPVGVEDRAAIVLALYRVVHRPTQPLGIATHLGLRVVADGLSDGVKAPPLLARFYHWCHWGMTPV